MARAYRGPYARPSAYPVPYATANVWGTGIDPIHSYYGEGPPVRVRGRSGASGSSPVDESGSRRDYQQAADSESLNPDQSLLWGYPDGIDYSPDSFGGGADAPISTGDTAPGIHWYQDDRPAWNEAPAQERARTSTGDQPSWGSGGGIFRAIRGGAHTYRLWHVKDSGYSPITAEQPDSNPTETVSEGWRNKVTSFVADANPSAPGQYEVQTSMRQRYGVRDNNRAQLRNTDDPRSRIASRVMPMVEKVYSTGERLYDMFPYQIDQMERPFTNRTAGVGRADWMLPNAYHAVSPIERTPPPDPGMGMPEVSDYGYTGEDTMYYG